MNRPGASNREVWLLYSLTESARAIRAINEVFRLCEVRLPRKVGEARENIAVLDQVRLALQAAANVSKVFDDDRNATKAAKRRARELAVTVGIEADHPIHDRSMRDSIDHFDERLDSWLAQSSEPFLTTEMVQHGDFPLLTGILMIYDERAREVRVLDQACNLDGLKESLEDVQRLVSEAFNSLWSDAVT